MGKFTIVKCNYCGKDVEKPTRFLGYNSTFCNRKCHGDYKLANPKLCTIDGCDKKRSAKGLCQHHYDMDRKTDPKRIEATRASAVRSSQKIKQKRQEDPIFDAEFRQKSRMFDKKYKSENKEKLKKSDLDSWNRPKRRYTRARRCAEDRGIEFTLSLEEYSYLARQGNDCYYECGNVIVGSGIGLDRMDNTIGYTLENSVPCCGFCNIIKNAYISSEEMLEVVKLLKKVRNTDNIWENSESGRKININRKSS